MLITEQRLSFDRPLPYPPLSLLLYPSDETPLALPLWPAHVDVPLRTTPTPPACTFMHTSDVRATGGSPFQPIAGPKAGVTWWSITEEGRARVAHLQWMRIYTSPTQRRGVSRRRHVNRFDGFLGEGAVSAMQVIRRPGAKLPKLAVQDPDGAWTHFAPGPSQAYGLHVPPPLSPPLPLLQHASMSDLDLKQVSLAHELLVYDTGEL